MSEGNIYFHSEDAEPMLPSETQQVKDWLRTIVNEENRPLGDVNYIFCSDEYLHRLNKQYLHHDSLTDVITFDHTSENGISGDVYISSERAEDNSISLNVNVLDEISRLMIHGLLHLLGYSDKTPADKQNMTAKEDYYLSLRAF